MVWGPTRPPFRRRIGPIMMLVDVVDMMLQIFLVVVKLILPTEHLDMLLRFLLSMLDLQLINVVHPQVKTRELLIHILVEVLLIKTGGFCSTSTPSGKGFGHLFIMSHPSPFAYISHMTSYINSLLALFLSLIHINVVIIVPIRGIGIIGVARVWEENEGFTMVVCIHTFGLIFKDLHVEACCKIQPPWYIQGFQPLYLLSKADTIRCGRKNTAHSNVGSFTSGIRDQLSEDEGALSMVTLLRIAHKTNNFVNLKPL